MWPEVTERAAPLLVTSDTPGTTAQAAARLSLGQASGGSSCPAVGGACRGRAVVQATLWSNLRDGRRNTGGTSPVHSHISVRPELNSFSSSFADNIFFWLRCLPKFANDKSSTSAEVL